MAAHGDDHGACTLRKEAVAISRGAPNATNPSIAKLSGGTGMAGCVLPEGLAGPPEFLQHVLVVQRVHRLLAAGVPVKHATARRAPVLAWEPARRRWRGRRGARETCPDPLSRCGTPWGRPRCSGAPSGHRADSSSVRIGRRAFEEAPDRAPLSLSVQSRYVMASSIAAIGASLGTGPASGTGTIPLPAPLMPRIRSTIGRVRSRADRNGPEVGNG